MTPQVKELVFFGIDVLQAMLTPIIGITTAYIAWQRYRISQQRPAGRTDPRSVARRTLPRLRYRTGHGVLRHLKRPAAPEYASRTPY